MTSPAEHRTRAVALMEIARSYPHGEARLGLLLEANVHASLSLAPATKAPTRRTPPPTTPDTPKGSTP